MLAQINQDRAPPGSCLDEAACDAPPIRSGAQDSMQKEHGLRWVGGFGGDDAVGKHDRALPQIAQRSDHRAVAGVGTNDTSCVSAFSSRNTALSDMGRRLIWAGPVSSPSR